MPMRTWARKEPEGADFSDFSARPSLGQHFLSNRAAVGQIIAQASEVGPDLILEIGPGRAALTDPLAMLGVPLTAIEKDERFALWLRDRFAGQNHIRVVHSDVLDCDLAAWLGEARCPVVVGNLPYNVAAPILFQLLALRRKIRRMVLMFQREVAERLVAQPGQSCYNALSVAVALLTQSRIDLRLKPEHFHPRPKVHSAVVVLNPRLEPLVPVDDAARFIAFVRSLFRYRRKALFAALKAARLATPEQARILAQAAAGTPRIPPAKGLTILRRAQEMDLPDLFDLYQRWQTSTR